MVGLIDDVYNYMLEFHKQKISSQLTEFIEKDR